MLSIDTYFSSMEGQYCILRSAAKKKKKKNHSVCFISSHELEASVGQNAVLVQ